MSAFVHGSYLSTLPTAEKPDQMVLDDSITRQVPEFVSAVSEYIIDVYVSSHQTNWLSLPEEVRKGINARLNNDAKIKLEFE